jgi:5-methylcytosine-specific restriction endonuclease McrA
MDNRAHSLFIKRTGDMFQNHKRRAREYSQELPFDIPTMRNFVKPRIGEPCPYCGTTLTVRNFSLDHLTPVSREPDFTIDNQVVCCHDCNQRKGMLNGQEFHALLTLISEWPVVVKRDILARLKAGGRFRHG